MSQVPRTRTRNPNTATSAASSGSQTILQTESGQASTPSATLRLRAAEPIEQRRIQWAEDVVDNEGMGKKSSKVCCIYHKPKEPGDSDSDGSSDSSSSGEDGSDDEPDLSRAQKSGGNDKTKRGRRRHDHNHNKDDKDENGRTKKASSPNAYERQPKQKGKTAG